jgi:hypothetical protein
MALDGGSRSTPRLMEDFNPRHVIPKFAYIAGTGFAGSTLLAFLLNAQHGIVSIGEVAWSVPTMNPECYPCSCGATLATCSFWQLVIQHMQSQGYEFSPNRWNMAFSLSKNPLLEKLLVRPLENDTLEAVRDRFVRCIPRLRNRLTQIGERNIALVNTIASLTQSHTFVDATKDPARVKFLIQYCGVEPYVIHLVRDAPAFVSSYVRHSGSQRTVRTAIRWWNATARRVCRLRSLVPRQRMMLVRYEDICAQPSAEVARIAQFLNAPLTEVRTDFRVMAHHIIGNRMRLAHDSSIILDTRWREDLSPRHLKMVLRQTMHYRKAFGYV